MQDGKPIAIPYGRRAPGVNKLEFGDLEQRLIALEAKVAELEAAPKEVAVEQAQQVEDHDPQDGDKPRRGRKPKEATE